jgi:hypothetical protein
MLPGIPFLALAIGMVIAEWRLAAPAAIVTQAIFCWPPMVELYTKGKPWRVEQSEWRAALRLEPDHDFIARNLPGYAISPTFDKMVPDGEPVLTLDPLPPVYHSRSVVENRDLRERIILGSPDPNILPAAGFRWLLFNTSDHRVFGILERAVEWRLEPRMYDHGWFLLQVR